MSDRKLTTDQPLTGQQINRRRLIAWLHSQPEQELGTRFLFSGLTGLSCVLGHASMCLGIPQRMYDLYRKLGGDFCEAVIDANDERLFFTTRQAAQWIENNLDTIEQNEMPQLLIQDSTQSL